MRKKTERLNRLIDVLRVRHFVPIKELAALFNVSEMTIRRDLAELSSSHGIETVAGTTVYNEPPVSVNDSQEYHIMAQEDLHVAQKEAIGRKAAQLIEPGDIILLDSGTTTERIVAHIPRNLGVTALCYNINLLTSLYRNPGVELLFAGGIYHVNTQMFESPEGIDFIHRIRAQKVFISAAGVHESLGVTCVNGYEAPTKRAVLSSSLEHILVVDSSKFGIVRSAYFCMLDDIHTIVTDCGLSEEWQQRIRDMGITLHLV